MKRRKISFSLPTDVLSLILGCLPRRERWPLRLVNKKWKTAVDRSVYCLRISVKVPDEGKRMLFQWCNIRKICIEQHWLRIVCEAIPRVSSIRVRGPVLCDEEDLRAVSSLRNLRVFFGLYSDGRAHALASDTIEHVTLPFPFGYNAFEYSERCRALVQRLPALSVITSLTKSLGTPMLSAILSAVDPERFIGLIDYQLTQKELSMFPVPSRITHLSMAPVELHFDFRGFSNLQTLRINWEQCIAMTLSTYTSILSIPTTLRFLHFDQSPRIHMLGICKPIRDAVLYWIKANPNLRELRTSSESAFPVSSFIHWAPFLINLEKLSYLAPNDPYNYERHGDLDAIRELGKHCPRLRVIKTRTQIETPIAYMLQKIASLRKLYVIRGMYLDIDQKRRANENGVELIQTL